MSKTQEKILYLIFDCFCALLLIFAIFTLATSISFRVNGSVKVFGTTCFYTQTSDMSPEYNQGEFIISTQKSEYAKGEIVAYVAKYVDKERFALGKVLSVETDGYVVCGTNPASSSIKVASDDILGQMTSQNKTVENLLNPLSDNTSVIVYIVIPAVVTLLYGATRLLFAIKVKRLKKQNS